MFHLRAIVSLLVLVAMPLAAADPVFTPQQGVLLLRNGNVMQGEVTRAGDYYIVTLGSSGEVRLPARDVEGLCVDLEDAYRCKLATIAGKDPVPHLDLAEWCLRNDLVPQAGEQLLAAMRKDPGHKRIAAVERKLKLALAAAPPPTERRTDVAATASNGQLDKAVQSLPQGTVEKFAAVVQPILLNRCAAGGCHGQTGRSDFRLLRPPSGQGPSKRFTQRNLYAVLQHLDKDNPSESPLLKLPQGRHGSTPAPVFDKRTQHQLDDLIAWTKLALDVPPPPPLATISRSPGHLSQAGSSVKPASAEVPVEPAAGHEDGASGAPPRPFEPPKEAVPLPREGAFTPRDPFDPEIFNRRFLKK